MTLSQFLSYPLTHRMISYDELMDRCHQAYVTGRADVYLSLTPPEPVLTLAPAKKRSRARKAA